MNRARPYHPAQTETGSTYVVDSRSGAVVATIAQGFDVVERWATAKRRAKTLNDAHERGFYRRRRTLALLLVMAVLAGVIAALFHG